MHKEIEATEIKMREDRDKGREIREGGRVERKRKKMRD